ncbi:MAG: PHP-associated domain-containing protein [Candidatus ainarchaeum sp.]|nr:PHP-associated domain-containing protein [Candidatus ainarchaeum sp.]
MNKPILAEMHTHLIEKKVKPKDYWKAVLEKKLKIIAITEHVEYNPKKAYLDLKKIKPKNIILIPGMEAKTSAGHLIIFGKDESIYNVPDIQTINIPIEKALQRIKEYNLTASFAHPYGYKTDSTCSIIGEKKTKELLEKYEIGTEYYNGMLGSATSLIFKNKILKNTYNISDYLAKHKKLKFLNKAKIIEKKLYEISQETFMRVKNGITFSENAKYITAGSDAHYPRNIGMGVVELKKMPKNESDFLKMIEKREIKWAGPNKYLKNPISDVKKIEMLMGLKYLTKKKILKDKIKKPKKKKIKLIKDKFKSLLNKTKKVIKKVKKRG